MTNKEITEMIKKYESKWGRLGYTNIMRPELNHSGAEGGTKMSSIANDLIAFRQKVAAGREANRQAHKTTVSVNDLNQRYFEELTTNGTLIHALPSLGEKRSDNKYYQKIDNYYPDGSARYFWSKDEWDAYQREKNAKHAQQAEAERKSAGQQSSTSKANHLAEAEAETAKRKEEAEAAKIKEENIRKNAAAASNAGADRAASESKSVNAQKSQASGAQAEVGAKIDKALKEGGTKAAVKEVTKTKEWDDYISVMKEAVNAGYDPSTMTKNQLKDADPDLGKRAEEAEKKFREMYGGDDASKRELKAELGKIAEEAINTAKSEKEAAKKTVADRDAAIKAGQKSEQDRQAKEKSDKQHVFEKLEERDYYLDSKKEFETKLEEKKKENNEKRKEFNEKRDDIVSAFYKANGTDVSIIDAFNETAEKMGLNPKPDLGPGMQYSTNNKSLYEAADKIQESINKNKEDVKYWQEKISKAKDEVERSDYEASKAYCEEMVANYENQLEDLWAKDSENFYKTFEQVIHNTDINGYKSINWDEINLKDKERKEKKESAKHSAFDDEDYLAHADGNTSGNKKYAAAHSATVDSEELMDEYSAFMERVKKGKEMNRLAHSSFISPAMLNRRYEEELDSKSILIHSGNFKYYNKIDLGNGKTRYFYTKAEWDAYNREKSSVNAADSEGAKYDAWKKEQAQKKAQTENIRKNTEAAGNAEKEKWESVKKTAAEAPKLASINIGANVAKAIGQSEMTHPLSQALSDNLGPDALSRALTSNITSLSDEEKIANDRAEISKKNDEGRDAAIAKSRKIEQDRMRAYEIEENFNKAIEEYNVVAKDLEEEYFSDVKTQKEYIEAMEDLIDDMKDCYEDVDNPDGVEITWSEDGAGYVANIPEYQERLNELSNEYNEIFNKSYGAKSYAESKEYSNQLSQIMNEIQLVTIESQSKIYPYLTNVFKEVLD